MCHLCLTDVAVFVIAVYNSGAFNYVTSGHPFNNRADAVKRAAELNDALGPSTATYRVLRLTQEH